MWKLMKPSLSEIELLIICAGLSGATGIIVTVSISAVCHVKASTDIKYYNTFSPVGGSPKYNLHVTIEKLDY